MMGTFALILAIFAAFARAADSQPFAGDSCESGQICPGDNLCSGACAGGLENAYPCEQWMASYFETNQCICSDRSAPCSSAADTTHGPTSDLPQCDVCDLKSFGCWLGSKSS